MDKKNEQLKQDLQEVNEEIRDQIASMSQVSELSNDVHTEIQRHQQLTLENSHFATACRKLLDDVTGEKDSVWRTERVIQAMEQEMSNIEQKVQDTLALGNELTEQARIRDEELIEDIVGKREFSKQRHLALKKITRQMNKVLKKMEKVVTSHPNGQKSEGDDGDLESEPGSL